MSHLSQGFQGLWHLMTFPEDVPLMLPAAEALTTMAKSPGDLSAAVVIGCKAYTALVAAHVEMSDEDKRIIPNIFHPALAHLRTLEAELAVVVNGSPARFGAAADPQRGIPEIPAVEAVPGDPSKAPALAAATKAHKIAEAAVLSAIAAAS